MQPPRDLDAMLRNLLNGNGHWDAKELAFFRSLVKRMEDGSRGIILVNGQNGLDYCALGSEEEALDILLRGARAFVQRIKERKSA